MPLVMMLLDIPWQGGSQVGLPLLWGEEDGTTGRGISKGGTGRKGGGGKERCNQDAKWINKLMSEKTIWPTRRFVKTEKLSFTNTFLMISVSVMANRGFWPSNNLYEKDSWWTRFWSENHTQTLILMLQGPHSAYATHGHRSSQFSFGVLIRETMKSL